MAAKVWIGRHKYVERKVQIAFTMPNGKTRVTARWLSQVEAYATKVSEWGGTNFRWRLHARAPWHEVKPS